MKQLNLFTFLIENLVSDEAETVEAGVVFVQLVSTHPLFAPILAGIPMAPSGSYMLGDIL